MQPLPSSARVFRLVVCESAETAYFCLHLNRKGLDHIIRLASLILDVDGVIVKGFPRIPVKKPSSILKIILERLGTSQDGDCERLCTSGDRRDFCAVLGTGHVVLTIDRYARVDAQPRPVCAVCGGLLDIQKQSMISWPSYSSHRSFLRI